MRSIDHSLPEFFPELIGPNEVIPVTPCLAIITLFNLAPPRARFDLEVQLNRLDLEQT
jgi:hypothetical protein